MKRGTFLASLWIATLAMLLSTVLLHHHHMAQICLAVEQCQVDGNLNDEHTEHHENEQEGCSVHQMHHFIVNAKVVKNIRQQLSAPTQALALVAKLLSAQPATVRLLSTSVFASDQRRLPSGDPIVLTRRGPPLFS